MSNTKKQLEKDTPKESQEEKVQKAKQVDAKIIGVDLHNTLVTYLQTKPFGEVHNLIQSLVNSPVTKVTITE